MHYILGVIVLIIIAIAVPTTFLALAVAFIVLSALVVMLATRIVTQMAPPLSDCVKAVVYSFIFTLIAGLISLKLLAVSPAAILLAPLLVVFSQTLAYSTTLNLNLLAGGAVSVCVTVLGWLLAQAFGVSALLAMKTFP